MKLFRFLNSMKFQDNLISVKDDKARYVNWIVNDREDKNFSKYPAPIGKINGVMDYSNIVTTDYLGSNISAPLFSSRAKDIFLTSLGDEFDFVKCKIICDQEILDFYFARVLKTLSLIDLDRSEYRDVLDHKVLSDIKYNHISEEFYIAKDIQRKDIVVVSELFVNLVIESHLKIDFIEI